MPIFEKHFTPDEARALIPELTGILREIQAVRSHLEVHWEQAAPVLRAARLNGGGKEAHAYLTDFHQLNRELSRLVELGVQLKDLEKGLVDFPAWRGGREVLLCWHLGEEDVAFWHEIDCGFAGRRPI